MYRLDLQVGNYGVIVKCHFKSYDDAVKTRDRVINYAQCPQNERDLRNPLEIKHDGGEVILHSDDFNLGFFTSLIDLVSTKEIEKEYYFE